MVTFDLFISSRFCFTDGKESGPRQVKSLMFARQKADLKKNKQTKKQESVAISCKRRGKVTKN